AVLPPPGGEADDGPPSARLHLGRGQGLVLGRQLDLGGAGPVAAQRELDGEGASRREPQEQLGVSVGPAERGTVAPLAGGEPRAPLVRGSPVEHMGPQGGVQAAPRIPSTPSSTRNGKCTTRMPGTRGSTMSVAQVPMVAKV